MHGLNPAVWIGAAVVGVGAVAAFAIPRRPQRVAIEAPEVEAALEVAA